MSALQKLVVLNYKGACESYERGLVMSLTCERGSLSVSSTSLGMLLKANECDLSNGYLKDL